MNPFKYNLLSYTVTLISIILTTPIYTQTSGKCIESNCQNGIGKMVFKNIGTYHGSFVNAKREGDGIFHYSNGDKYEGKFSNNMRHGGFGRFTFANEDTFVGTFINDVGKGTLKDNYENTIPGNLTIGNVFIEDRIAFDNMVAKIKESLVYVEIINETNRFTYLDSQTGFFISPRLICFPFLFTATDTIIVNMKFGNMTTNSNVQMVLLSGRNTTEHGGAIYKIVDNTVVPPNQTIKIEQENVVANTIVFTIGGPSFDVSEGKILSISGIVLFFEGFNTSISNRPVLNRSGKIIGIANTLPSIQNTRSFGELYNSLKIEKIKAILLQNQ